MDLNILIGPFKIRVSFPAGLIELSKSLSLFEINSTGADYFLETREEESLTIPPDAVCRRDYYFVQDGLSDLHYGNQNFSLRIDFVKKIAVLTVLAGFKDKRLLLFNGFKWFLSLITIDNGGIPLHCSNVIRNNKSLIFSGKSGAGKSTVSDLLSHNRQSWQRGSDEFNLIFKQGSEVYAYSTPYLSFNGELRISGALLVHLFFLKHSPRNSISALPKEKSYWNILKNVYTIPANEDMAQKMYKNVELITESLNCSELYFINDQSARVFIEDWMDALNV